MGKNVGLDELRTLFQDSRQHIGLGVVTKLAVLADRSAMRVQVRMFPEEREIVATMTWESTGPECGIIDLPAANDLVLVAFADGDPDQAYVIKRLTSQMDKLPLKAKDGHLVVRAKAGKKVFVDSDAETNVRAAKVQLMKTESEAATENLVLGQVFKAFMGEVLQMIAQHTHTSGPPGGPTSPPITAAQFTAKKSSPIDDGAILSDTAFTEK